jgi:MYXO-CTERM domain-containing protein
VLLLAAWLPLAARAAPALDLARAERPVWSPDGRRVAFSGEDGRGVYVFDLRRGELLTVTEAPSAGYAVRWSPAGDLLAFKAFVPDGTRALPWQVPVVFDVEARRLVPLGRPVARAGVPSFAASGAIAVSEGDRVLLFDAAGRPLAEHAVGGYSNLTPLAPGGDRVAYNDDLDAIWVLDTATGARSRVTAGGAWHSPVWSPDGQRLLVHGVSGRLACIDLARGRTTELPPALQATWLPDGETVVYASAAVPDVRVLPEADLRTIRCDGSAAASLTATPGVHESFPAVSPDGRRLIFRVEGQGLVVAPLLGTGALGPARPLGADLRATMIWPGGAPLPPPPPPDEVVPYAITNIDSVTYLHQVYDTPNDFDGNWACNATSAMMTIAWRGILPWWDCTVSVPTSHVSHWGRYVSQVYDYGGHHFSESSADPDGTAAYGGYGYITRNDWADTKGYMRDYLRLHGLGSEVDWSPSWDKVTAEIDARQPFVVLSSITTAGHYTVATGYYTDQHSIVFNDPYGNKNNGYMNYDGAGAAYDWPGYNNGLSSLNTVHCFIWSRAPAPGGIGGTVTDAASGLPVAGAAVSLSTGAQAATGADGTYAFDGLFPRDYTVTASAPCHGDATATATVATGTTATADLSLTDDGSCGAITGVVTDASTDLPLAGATVSLEGGPALETGADGAYSFEHLAPGDYTVTATAECHVAATAPAAVAAGAPTTVDLSLATDASCDTTGAITGVVTDADTGAPLEGVAVTLDGDATATTDAAGRYDFADVAAGAHAVTARAECFTDADADVTVTAGATATADLALLPIADCVPAQHLAGACGCVVGARGGPAGAVALVALALLASRRRRARPR